MQEVADHPEPKPTQGRIRILYVDDDRAGAHLVRRNLERRGDFRVELADNGQVGFDLAMGSDYDVLLLDNAMPGMGGMELIRALRDGGNFVPVIMVTGAGDEKTAVEALKSGCSDYVVKDVAGTFLHLLPAVIEQVFHQVESERMLAEKRQENQRLLADLVETNKELKRSNELKNEVLGIAAHDLRTSLTSILGAIECVVAGESGMVRQEVLDICQKSAEQALSIIVRMLDSARLEGGDIELRRERAEVTEIVREVIQVNQANAMVKRIDFVFRNDGPTHAHIDSFRFRELTDNLVSNAIKYSRPGGTVTLRTWREEAACCMSVADSGPGFTEEDRRHVFKRFHRLSARPTGNEPSTGLGLYIVKKIVDQHGGDIVLNSSPGCGAEFIVSFPDG